MNMCVVPPTLSPCPNCKKDAAVFKKHDPEPGVTKLWFVSCSACGAYGIRAASRPRAAMYWHKGEVLTPLDAARVDKYFSTPHLFRTSFPGLGRPPSHYRIISGLTSVNRLQFFPGKLGRVDIFLLDEGGTHPDHPRPYVRQATLETQPGAETLAVLQELDELVSNDPELVASPIYGGGRLWFLFPRKGIKGGLGMADSASLYEQRMIERERLLRGEIKRGHKAFGFFPLDGCE